MTETIAAIATPSGVGGIGIVRVSGSNAKGVLKSLWKTSWPPVDKFESHRLYLGNFYNLSTGDVVDEGLAVWFQAPHSYTGEDVVEIHCHGSPLILEGLLGECLEAGAKLAGSGEFTKRAFLNGRLDLAQAEAVAQIIAATGERGRKASLEQLSGRFSEGIRGIQKEVLSLRAFVEATIDFPEEDIEIIRQERIGEQLTPIILELKRLAQSYREGKLFAEGVITVITGRPNVGKSSLLNALLGIPRALVHEKPGTTRDIIEEHASFEGILFRLLDTAGVRVGGEEVEEMGISLTKEWIERADLILWVLDAKKGVEKGDLQIASLLDPEKTILCHNKMDLVESFEKFSMDGWSHCPGLGLSALQGRGLQELSKAMVEFVKNAGREEGVGTVVTQLRHKLALEKALKELHLVQNLLEEKAPTELLAQKFRSANESLGEITGEFSTEALLDEIFSKFCIGK